MDKSNAPMTEPPANYIIATTINGLKTIHAPITIPVTVKALPAAHVSMGKQNVITPERPEKYIHAHPVNGLLKQPGNVQTAALVTAPEPPAAPA